MDAGSLMEALDIMFTVIVTGLIVVIMGAIVVPCDRYARMSSVYVGFWACCSIAAKRSNFWYQRTGRLDKMFSPMKILLYEIATSLMLLQILLFSKGRPDQRVLARPSVPFFLVGLAITGYGMVVSFSGGSPSVFFLGDFGVYLVSIGLIVIFVGRERARAQDDDDGLRVGVYLIIYILVLLVATYITGDWKAEVIDSRLYYCYVV